MLRVKDEVYNENRLELKMSSSQISEEMKEQTEKRTIEYYREHPDKIGDILAMLKEEAQRHLVTASIEAGNEPTLEERRKLKELVALPDGEEKKNALGTLTSSLSPEQIFTYDLIFSDDSLRTRLYLALGAYLNLLQGTAPEIFQEACDFIENCITDKKQLAIKWQKDLGVFPGKSVAILNITTRRAKESVFGVSKVEGAAFDARKNDYFYGDLAPIQVAVGIQKKRTISTMVSIDFNKMKKLGVTIGNEHRLTPYDREVHNAVSTLCAAGNEYINPQMIYQVLSGNKPEVKMTSKTREEILDSIDKMMFTEIEIDASEEVYAGWNKKAKYKGPLIPSERVEIVKLNGQEVLDCIHIFRSLPLYDYANNKSQIDRVDIKMLDAPLNNTPENIEIKGYLLRRIASIKNPNSKLIPIIRYDTLYEYLGITAPNEDALRTKKKEIRNKVKTLLSFWQKEGFIKGYQEEKEGKTLSKIKITL